MVHIFAHAQAEHPKADQYSLSIFDGDRGEGYRQSRGHRNTPAAIKIEVFQPIHVSFHSETAVL
jgi:hypothetical protein